MKKILFTIVFFSYISHAQFVETAPWVEDIKKYKSTNEDLNINEIKASFDNYWQSKDKNERGSGYKPFMRWHYQWKNFADNEGKLQNSIDFWKAWETKENFKKNNRVLIPESNWTPLGPDNHVNTGSWSTGRGRVNIIEVDPNNANTWYMGTPAGGIWKSTNAGGSWSPLSDYLPQIGVSGIAIDPTNSNIIYISTGDKDAADSFSFGVFKSIDGGQTWQTTGFTQSWQFQALGDIIINPNDANQLFLATNTGLFRSNDGGSTWSNRQSGNFTQGNIRFNTANANIIYAVSNNRFYRSTDSGNTFVEITTGLPTNSTRLVMDVTPNDSNYIYILAYRSGATNFGFQGVYRSTNGGDNFTARNTSTNILESSQAWFDLAIAVSSTNKDVIFTGCLNVWRSTNGGTNFTKINSWSEPTSASYTHADIHYLGFKGNRLFCGSDGGIYSSTDNGVNFANNTSNATIGQFYRISVSPNTTSKIMGGLQDNGGFGLNNNVWRNFYGADGMDAAIHPSTDNTYYGFIQSGLTLYYSTNGGVNRHGGINSPGGIEGNWVTPLAINSAGQLFSGFNRLYRLSGTTSGPWVAQSSNTFSGNISWIAIDPSNNANMFLSVGNELFKSTNTGASFVSVSTFGSSITSIDVHSTNSNIVYVTTSGWSGNRVFRSTDGGSSFSSITDGAPSIPINVIKYQNGSSNDAVYIGTAHGVYYRDNTNNMFVPFDTNLPNVSVRDIEINTVDQKIVIATFGRGVWMSDLPTVFNEVNFGLNCADAIEIETGNHSSSPNSGNGAVNVCGLNGATHARWYSYTAVADGQVTIKSCGGVDTRLSVLQGECNALTCVVSSDDDNDLTCHPQGYASSVNFSVTSGQTYLIQWDNRWTTNEFNWSLTLVPNLPSIASTSCNSTINLFHYDLINANNYPNATNYRFRIGTSTFESSTGSATLANILGQNITFNINYEISVAAFAENVWTDYGVSCTISTTNAPLTEIQYLSCGSTIPNLGTNIYFKNGYNVEMYEYRLTRSSDNFIVGTFQSINRFVKLTNFNGVSSAVQYNLQARMQHNGIWGNWSMPCHIFSPNNITTQLRPSYCNQPLANNFSPIYAKGVVGATEYEFRVTNTTTNQTGTIERQSSAFHLGQVAGITVNSSTTYNVEVRVKINNIWGPYGTMCTVITPSLPNLLNNLENLNLNNQIIVYPNPTDEYFTIKFPTPDLAIIYLLDMNGKEIYKKQLINSYETEIGHQLTAGVYMIKVEQNGENYSFKVIKK